MNKNIQKSKVFKKMTKKDYLIMIIITILYAILAFINLGDMNVPTSYAELNKGDVIEIEFNNNEKLSSIRFRNGWIENVNYSIKSAENKNGKWAYNSDKVKGEDGKIEKEEYSMGYCFTWDYWFFCKEARYLEIKVDNKDSAIAEMVFLDEDKKIIEPKSVKVNGKKIKELTDEQDKLQMKSTFKDSPYFDEYLYAQSAYEYMNGLGAIEWTHPPLGKCLIAMGMQLFGETPFGWRFVGTLFGVLMLPIMYIMAKKIFGKTFYSTLACGMFALDFMHFTQTRIGTIDVFVVFFIMLMYYFMYLYYESSFYDTKLEKTWIYLLGSGISMGLAVATKWTGCYSALGLAVIFFLAIYKRTKEMNIARKNEKGNLSGIKNTYILKVYKPYLVKTLLLCIGAFVVIPMIIYALSYIPFRLEDNVEASFFERLVQNQKDMFSFHIDLQDTNKYESKWYTWPLVIQPILYTSGILSATDRYGISAMGNPFIWWAGIISFVYMIYLIIKKKDKRAAFLCIAYLAQYLPWVFVSRMTFIYHYFTCVPFVVLMNVYAIKNFMGEKISKKKIIYLTLYLVAILVSFVMFYPVISGQPVRASYVHNTLRWLEDWILVH